MLSIGDKIENGGATTSGQLSADEYNNHKNELQNAVTRTNQTLSGASELQLSTALTIVGCAAHTFSASGTANAIVLTPPTGTSGFKIPETYDEMNGFHVYFYAIATNTGNTTINIGQSTGSLIGSKQLLLKDGSQIPASMIVTDSRIDAIYDPTADGSTGAWLINEVIASNVLPIEIVDAQSTFDDVFSGLIENRTIFIKRLVTNYTLNTSVSIGSNVTIYSNGAIVERNGSFHFSATGTSPAWLENIHMWGWTFDGQGGLGGFGGSTTYTGDAGFLDMIYVRDSSFTLKVRNSKVSGEGGAYRGNNFTENVIISNISYCEATDGGACTKMDKSTISYIDNCNATTAGGACLLCNDSTIHNISDCTATTSGGAAQNSNNCVIYNIKNCSSVSGGAVNSANYCNIFNISDCSATGNGGAINTIANSNISNIENCTATGSGGACYGCDNCNISNLYTCIANVDGGGCANINTSNVSNLRDCNATTGDGGGVENATYCDISNIVTCEAVAGNGGGVSSSSNGQISNIQFCEANSGNGGGAYQCNNTTFLGAWNGNAASVNNNIDNSTSSISFCQDGAGTAEVNTTIATINWN